MSLNSAAIGTGIAALSIAGVTVLDVTAIPDQVQARDCPILFPHPNSWIGGGNAEPSDGPATFGTSTSHFWMFGRRFEYVYLHVPVGAMRGLKDIIGPMSTNIDTILTALTTLDLTNIDVKSVAISSFGVITDPSSGKFYGCFVDVVLRERLNP